MHTLWAKKREKKILRKKTTQKKNEKNTKTAFIIMLVNSVFDSYSIIINYYFNKFL